MPTQDQLKEKLIANSLPVSCGCHIWLLSATPTGYGRIAIGCQKMEYAHRVSYEVHKGNIPKDKLVMHSCDNPSCVNPEHLSIGTQGDNMQDCSRKGRVRNGGTKGESNGRSKLNNETALAAYLDPRDSKEIAKEYGVTATAIRLLKGGNTWQHVTMPKNT